MSPQMIKLLSRSMTVQPPTKKSRKMYKQLHDQVEIQYYFLQINIKYVYMKLNM